MKKKLKLLLLFLIIGLLSGTANATILTFDGLSAYNYDPIDGNYGDSVSTPNDAYGSYEMGNGFTPNINVSYNTVGSNAYLEAWNTGYGDLVKVAYADNNDSIAEITFTADLGYQVSINSFDMAGFGQGDNTLDLLEIVDDAGNIVWTASALQIQVEDDAHSSFYPVVMGTELTIRWGDNWNIGIDNINFDQIGEASVVGASVPVPSALLLLASGLLGLAGVRRKKTA
nr:PEP-CTERM sorting domain-containing protein [uncultured Desulfobacter sp.]